MANASGYKRAAVKFDPCELFPARVATKKTTATAQEAGATAGSASVKDGTTCIPIGDTAYDRTVRRHEAGHHIYSKIDDFDPSMLGQALEDAYLHAVCLPGEDVDSYTRRDEISVALRDIHVATSRAAMAMSDKNLDALLALRAAAILMADGQLLPKRLADLCAKVAPDYLDSVITAVTQLKAGKKAEAKTTLTPYFDPASKAPKGGSFPLAGKLGKGPKGAAGDGTGVPSKDVSFAPIEGKLSSDAIEMLSPRTVESLKSKGSPKLKIHQLWATSMIPTYFGEDHKHTLSGCKIDAKKLACTVGPATPRVFLKSIRRNGGTVVIDASGSMAISPTELLAMIEKAPLATIAFYNAPSDGVCIGNLWIFAEKGKRALDFSEIDQRSPIEYQTYKTTRGLTDYKKGPFGEYLVSPGFEGCWGSGNVVDFQVIQWLLQQPAPRYILTDGGFTGPDSLAASELLTNAIARKKLTQVTSKAAMQEILRKNQLALGGAK